MQRLSCAVLALVAAPVAAETPAGAPITNVATLAYRTADGERQVASNPVTFVVAERLDVRLAADPAPLSVAAGDPAVMEVILTNVGNGAEAFTVSADPGARVAVVALAIDGDGDGRFDPAHDTLLADGRTPVVAAGATLRLLLVLRADAAPAAGDRVTVTARAVTASGAPGTEAAGAGDGGGDAVVGTTGAAATVSRPLVGDGVAAGAPTLAKSVTIIAPDGSARPVSGAAATYTLAATFPAALDAARIDDAVPAGTRYRPGSLTLDDAALSDAADADPGEASDAAVAVTLGAVAAGSTHTVRFTVILP